jgi:hypothetical protein
MFGTVVPVDNTSQLGKQYESLLPLKPQVLMSCIVPKSEYLFT